MKKDSEYLNRLNSILGRFVDSNGKVDYDSLKEETDLVEKYVEWIKSYNLESLETLNEKMAFWINTYNMLTIYGIINESIQPMMQ
jgi:Zn-finger domain-containing protein